MIMTITMCGICQSCKRVKGPDMDVPEKNACFAPAPYTQDYNPIKGKRNQHIVVTVTCGNFSHIHSAVVRMKIP